MGLLDKTLIGGLTSGVALTAIASESWAAAAAHGCRIFCFHGAPAPVAGAGLPMIVAAGVAFLLIRRFRRKAH